MEKTKTQNNRALLLGAGGMLGGDVYRAANKLYKSVLATDIDLNEPWLVHQDFRDIGSLKEMFCDFKPDIVFHIGALTDLEYCESNQTESWETNALGTENTALLAENMGVTMVYISTAGIFGGEQACYTDFDSPRPSSHYAKSKYYGELFVERKVSRHFVFRAGWMMGGGPKKDKKFINKIYKKIKAGERELFVVDDKAGSPTYTKDFADAIMEASQTDMYGVYNLTSGGGASRADVAAEFVRLLGLDGEVRVNKVGSQYWSSEYFAPRPDSEVLVNMKSERRGFLHMRDWKSSLAEYAEVFRDDLRNDLQEQK